MWFMMISNSDLDSILLLPSAMTNRAFVGTATLVIPEPGAK